MRDWFAESLGVREDKKEEIYLQVSRSATLIDFSYWSQVLFSAGIATLGLALNSPAVIIGAMLISPLMGPILASGLALAAGDFVLGTRAAATVSSELLTKAREGAGNASPANDEKRVEELLTIGQLETNYAQAIEAALGDLRLPAPATFVDYEVTTQTDSAPRINLVYASERPIEPDAQVLLVDEVRKQFENPEAHVNFERIETTPVSLTFRRNQTQIETEHAEVLDRFGQQLHRFASLRIEMVTGADRNEGKELAEERGRAITAYFSDKWKINPERIELQSNDLQKREATLKFRPATLQRANDAPVVMKNPNLRVDPS